MRFPKKVVQHSSTLVPDQLVSVTQYHRGAIGPPIAVGRMAVSSETLRSAEEKDVKGKAVYVLHTWKDALWDMGPSKKADPPAPVEIKLPEAEQSAADENVPAGLVEHVTGDSTEQTASDEKPVQHDQPPAESEAPTYVEPTETKAGPLSPEGLSCCVL